MNDIEYIAEFEDAKRGSGDAVGLLPCSCPTFEAQELRDD
jgi:hypothetical protein